MIACVGIFFAFFSLYARTASPHVAPYRDAGEMAALLGTLGVAHPPGYPLYTLMGRIAMLLPVGNLVYRANVFSAFCAALALVFLFLTLRTWLRAPSALAATCFFAFSNPFWDLATVSEMYALGILWFCLLLFVTFRMKNPLLFAFLMALGLGARMDMLLLVPIFLGWFWFNKTRREIPWMVLFLGLGASVFLYLMVRSLGDPAIDWANPDNLLAVFNSARRKNYSGTLDLLSLSYKAGENFPVNLRLYGEHLVKVLGWGGAALSILGWWNLFRVERRVGVFMAVVFVVTGPLFLYLANMPPNPHALAIVEASYLIPDLICSLVIGWGVDFLIRRPGMLLGRDLYQEGSGPSGQHNLQKNRGPGLKIAGATILLGVVACLGWNAHVGYARASKRHNFYARDFVENVFRSAPRSSVLVYQKDVQLFSLWAAQLLDRRRPDVSLVATGLSASPWFWDMKKRWKTAAAPEISLKEAGGWRQMYDAVLPRPLLAGFDVDLNLRMGLEIRPHGVLLELTARGQGAPDLSALSLCVFRGPYVYGQTPDFFSTDLIGDAARAHHQQGFYLMKQGAAGPADWFLRRSESIDPTFGRATSDRAYLAFTQGNIEAAYALYKSAAQKAERTVQLSAKYKSLPGVAEGCREDASGVLTQWGAMAERLGRLEEARTLYLRALSFQENAQAHYNLAVTYWGSDWGQVVTHMRRALQINPQMEGAEGYLAKALSMAGQR